MATYYRNNQGIYMEKADGSFWKWNVEYGNYKNGHKHHSGRWAPFFPRTINNQYGFNKQYYTKITPKAHNCTICKNKGCALCCFDPFAIANIARKITQN